MLAEYIYELTSALNLSVSFQACDVGNGISPYLKYQS